MAESGVYKITNTVTKDFYIGSSKNVKRRWTKHKSKSTWKRHPNNPMYLDMKKYGVDSFEFQVIAEVESEKLKEAEQQFIKLLKPTYNSNNAKGLDIERYKEYQKEYQKEYRQSEKGKESLKEYKKSDKYKEYNKKYSKEYRKSDKYKEYSKEYRKSDKYKESHRKANNKYNNQFCSYNNEILTLSALTMRFRRAGIKHPNIEANKYILKKEPKNPIEFYDVYP